MNTGPTTASFTTEYMMTTDTGKTCSGLHAILFWFQVVGNTLLEFLCLYYSIDRCSAGMFSCSEVGPCIREDRYCDGYVDCIESKADEMCKYNI